MTTPHPPDSLPVAPRPVISLHLFANAFLAPAATIRLSQGRPSLLCRSAVPPVFTQGRVRDKFGAPS